MSKKIHGNFLLGLSSILISSSFTSRVIAEEFTLTRKDSASFCDSHPTKCQASAVASKLSFTVYEEYGGKKRSALEIEKDIASQGWTNVKFVDAPGDAQAILAKKELNGKNYYAIIFRGTEGLKDVATDLIIDKTNFSNDGKAQVHKGFFEYTKSIYRDSATEKFLAEIIKDPNAELLLTGHSLGGAAAEVFTAILKETGINKKINTVVFGSPPPGNKSFANKYLTDVIKVKTDYDPVTSSTTNGVPILRGFWDNIIGNGYWDDYGTTIKVSDGTNIIDAHNAYEEKIKNVLKDKIENINANNFNLYNSCITLGTSSHINSSSCFMRSNNAYINIVDKRDSIAKILIDQEAKLRNEQEKGIYTNGVITNAPIDIGLTWNQFTQLDLDSHTVTPSGDHVYFSQRGSLENAPNTFLYRDSIPASGKLGAEQTRITSFQDGTYRFYIYNFSDQQNLKPNSLPNSGAKVELFQGGPPLTNIPNDPNTFDLSNPALQKTGDKYPGTSTFEVPINQAGNTWYVFNLNTRTGILNRVDRFSNVDSSSNVPKFK
jgi:Lipase (class 3)